MLQGSKFVTVAVGVGDEDGVGAALGVGLGVGLATGEAFLTVTPLLHTRFFPDLIQVYLTAAYVLVCPSFGHFVPGFTAAVATGSRQASTRVTVSNTRSLLRISKLWSS